MVPSLVLPGIVPALLALAGITLAIGTYKRNTALIKVRVVELTDLFPLRALSKR